MELSSRGIKLFCSAQENGTYKSLYGLRSVPAMGGDAKRIDVTGLGDKNMRSIRGVKDLGELSFDFFYNIDVDTENVTADMIENPYSLLRGYDVAGTNVWFKLVYPDESGFKWKGSVTVVRSKADVNAALEFVLKVTVLTELFDL